jgi:hypothetical protein
LAADPRSPQNNLLGRTCARGFVTTSVTRPRSSRRTSWQAKAGVERFEAEEDRLFGDEGIEKTVDRVAAIEKQLGIYDLAQFTPK